MKIQAKPANTKNLFVHIIALFYKDNSKHAYYQLSQEKSTLSSYMPENELAVVF